MARNFNPMVARDAAPVKRLWPLLLRLWLCSITTTVSASDTVELTDGTGARGIERSMGFLPDRGQPMADLVKRFRNSGLTADFATADRMAAAYQGIWGVTELHRGSAGTREGRWSLLWNTYGTLELQVYLLRRSGVREQLLAYDYRSPFDPAQRSVTRLRSKPFALALGERAHLVVWVVNGPVRALSADLLTARELASETFDDGLVEAAFYSFSLSTLIFFFGFHASLGNRIGAAYAAQFALGLAFLAYLDGFLFRFVYPELPEWHLPLGLVILNLFSTGGLLLAAADQRRLSGRRRLAGLTRAMAGVAPLSSLGAYPASVDLAVNLGYLWVILMLAAHIVAWGRWSRENAEQRLARVINGLLLGALLVMLLFHAFGHWPAAFQITVLLKLLYGVIALLTMVGLTLHLVTLRREHRRALQDRVDVLSREAEQNRRLLDAERAYAQARDLAALRRHQLATASHDIKQPLASLRMSFDALGDHLDPVQRRSLTDAFSYLESLSSAFLDDSAPGAADRPMVDGDGPDGESAAETEPYALSLVLRAVKQMFNEEAVSKQIRLRVVDSRLMTRVDTLSLMRIVSNLTANAIRYTERGGVVVGVRRRPDGPVIEVIDSGRGMSNGEITGFREAHAKSEDSPGSGLGLAICSRLAARLGTVLEIRSMPGKGTRIRVPLRD